MRGMKQSISPLVAFGVLDQAARFIFTTEHLANSHLNSTVQL